MLAQQTFTYRAFISYSSRDRLIGSRFQTALEKFKIPRSLRGRETRIGKVPKRIAPIFRDRSDLEASEDLGRRIEAALVASQSLIVLCSPNSAASKWVNQEIITFKRLGREAQIIAVLVDGQPLKYDAELAPLGAFPPALIHDVDSEGNLLETIAPEPFAPDLREMQPDGSGGDGFEYAKLKVVARLIDIPLGELTQRQREVERRERRIIQGVAATMLVLAIGATTGGWWAWRQTQEANARLNETIDTAARQIGTATNYRERYGVPTKVITEMLKEARRDFSGLLKNVGRTPQLALQNARLSLTFADAYEAIDRKEEQQQVLGEADRELDWLAQRKPTLLERIGLDAAPSARSIASAHARLLDARVQQAIQAHSYDLAKQLADERLELVQQWFAKTGKSTWRREQARAWLRLGDVHYKASAPKKSRTAYVKGIAEIKALLADDDKPLYRKDLYDGVTWLAQLLVENAAHAEGLAQQQEAQKVAKRLLQDEPDIKGNKRRMAQVTSLIGDATLNLTGDPSKALPHYVEAERMTRELVGAERERVDWRRDLWVIQERLGSVKFQLGRFGEAEQAFAEALAIAKDLLQRDPDGSDRKRDISVMHERLSQLYGTQAQKAQTEKDRSGYMQQALQSANASITIRRDLRALRLEDPVTSFDLAAVLITLARIHALDPSHMPDAWRSLDEAHDLLKNLTVKPDKRLGWFHTLAAVHTARAQFFVGEQKKDEALKALHSALNQVKKLRAEEPDNQRFIKDEKELKKYMSTLRSG